MPIYFPRLAGDWNTLSGKREPLAREALVNSGLRLIGDWCANESEDLKQKLEEIEGERQIQRKGRQDS